MTMKQYNEYRVACEKFAEDEPRLVIDTACRPSICMQQVHIDLLIMAMCNRR